jgi:hypothetical protein
MKVSPYYFSSVLVQNEFFGSGSADVFTTIHLLTNPSEQPQTKSTPTKTADKTTIMLHWATKLVRLLFPVKGGKCHSIGVEGSGNHSRFTTGTKLPFQKNSRSWARS